MEEDKDQNKIQRTNRIYAYSILTGVLLLALGVIVFFLVQGKPVGEWPFVMLAILGLVLVLAVVFALQILKKKEVHEPDYYVFFVIGITWIPLGIVLENFAFIGMGVLFMIVGLKNKDKWKKKKFSKLSSNQRKLKLALLIGLVLLVLVGVAAYFLAAN